MVTRMTDKKKEFVVNDLSIASFLKNHGSKMIGIRNGKYIFEYDDTIDENMKLFMDMQDKCMF